RHRFTLVGVLERGRGDVNCDQLFWAVNVGFGSHDRVKTGKTQNRKWFPLCPRKRTCIPILELLPPPASSRTPPSRPRASVHSRRWAAIFVVAVGQRPEPRRPHGGGGGLQDAADHKTAGQHIVIVITPLTGLSARRGALKDQIILVHFT